MSSWSFGLFGLNDVATQSGRFWTTVAIAAAIARLTYIRIPPEVMRRQRIRTRIFDFSLRMVDLVASIVGDVLGHRAKAVFIQCCFGLQKFYHPFKPSWCKLFWKKIANIQCRVYVPRKEKRKTDSLIVFIHGGGWCVCGPEHYDHIIFPLVEKIGCSVVSVNFTLSPKALFPSCIDECEKVIREIYAKEYKSLGVNKHQIVVLGDSAGGHTATVLCQRFRKAKESIIKHQILVYPVISALNMMTPSQQHYQRHYPGVSWLLTPMYCWFWMTHLGIPPTRRNVSLMMANQHVGESIRRDPLFRSVFDVQRNIPVGLLIKMKGVNDSYGKPPDSELSALFEPFLRNAEANPIMATDLTGLTPALVITAAADIIRDEGILYVQRLRKFDVPTKWIHREDTFHGVWNTMGHRRSDAIIADIADYLSEVGF